MLMQEGDEQAGWQYTGAKTGQTKGETTTKAVTKPSSVSAVTWTASEYVEHDKSAGWYIRFALVAVLGIGVIFFLTRDFMSVILLGVIAVAFGIFAARKPSVLQYKLESSGITIGSKFYPINLFRSFAVVEEGAFHTITLLPLKRFMPAISLYYAPDDEPAILKTFSALLPQESRSQDALDKFMHHIRF